MVQIGGYTLTVDENCDKIVIKLPETSACVFRAISDEDQAEILMHVMRATKSCINASWEATTFGS